MHHINYYLITFFLLLNVSLLSAQSSPTMTVGTPTYNGKWIVCIVQDTLFASTAQEVLQHIDTKTAFYLLNGSSLSPEAIRDSLNYQINSQLRINKSKVYLTIIGDNNFYYRHARLEPDIFAEQRLIRWGTADNYTKRMAVVPYDSRDWRVILYDFNKHQLMQLEVEELRRQHTVYQSKKTGNKIRELRWSKIITHFKNVDGEMPSDFSVLATETRRKLKPNFEITNSLSIGFRRPKPPTDLQSQLFEQIDIASVLDGTVTEQEVSISSTISAFGYANVNVQGRYVFNNPDLQPYFAAGLSYTLYAGLTAMIDTTFVVDLSGGFGNFGGGFGDFELGADGGGFDRGELLGEDGPELISRVGIPLTVGVHRKLNNSERWALDLQLTYDLDPAIFGSNKAALSTFSVGCGLSLRLWGKRKKYYEFFQLEEIRP